MDTIEKWSMGEYFYNMLRYAAKKKLCWPRIDFTLNGQLLFRLEVDDDVDEQEDEAVSESGASPRLCDLELTLKYFGLQTNFLVPNRPVDMQRSSLCTFETLSDDPDDQKTFKECALDTRFDMVLEDEDSPSGLCYAALIETIHRKSLANTYQLIKHWFVSLQKTAETTEKFSGWPQWTVERLFYNAAHDARCVAYEVSATEQTPIVDPVSDDDFARELNKIEQEEQQQQRKQAGRLDDDVSSCQLHADVWQYNDKHNIMAVGRQYENLDALDSIDSAKHVPFRGPPDDLQKKLYIAEYLVKMLPTLCVSLMPNAATS